MQPGKLRHRIAIERPATVQDPVTLELRNTWATFETDVPAEVVPLSGREFVAAQAEQAGVTTRITIRYLPGVLPEMRVRHLGVVHNIKAVLPDPTFRKHLTLMCEAGVPSPPVEGDSNANAVLTEEGESLLTEAGDMIELEA